MKVKATTPRKAKQVPAVEFIYSQAPMGNLLGPLARLLLTLAKAEETKAGQPMAGDRSEVPTP